MKKYVVILTLVLAFNSLGQLFTFRNINHKNGLVLSSVLSVAQDKKGYIWLGTDGAGLQRYDGKNLEIIDVKKDNPEHHVSSIEATDEGIYFSSRYRGFFRYFNNKITKLVADHRDFGECFAVKKSGKLILLAGSEKLKLIKDGKVIKEVILKENISSVVQILELSDGFIFISDQVSYYISEKGIVEINNWLKLKSKIKPEAVSLNKNKLTIYDFRDQILTTVYLGEHNKVIKTKQYPTKNDFEIQVKKAVSKNNQLLILDVQNNLYYKRGNDIKSLPKNNTRNSFVFESVFIDNNDDFWATTINEGVYKISEEPFTKIDLDEVYQHPLITFIFKSKKNEVLISNADNKTFISLTGYGDFKQTDLRVFSHTTYRNLDLFATDKGIYYLDQGKLLPYKKIPLKEKCGFVFSDNENIYFSPLAQGLFVYNEKMKKTRVILSNNVISHVYTAQINQARTKIYFGTNDGVYEYQPKKDQISNITGKFSATGSYCGGSTVDSHGTIWFTCDKVLMGISEREEYLTISDRKHFNSTLFYTFNSDCFGNLIIGTNQGISKLKVDQIGNVISAFHYDEHNGFEGYETHMRSCFQSGNLIFVGTIEGLFSINTEKLEKHPPAPVPLIFQGKEVYNKQFNSDEELVKVNFQAINPKLKGILYSYRLRGKTRLWSDLSPKTEAYFSNLSDQEYIFEVKSTYDGLNFSPVASYKIIKETPFWKSKWFILFLILSIALANIIVLDRTKSFELSQIIENQNIEINSRIRSIILAFGFAANAGANYLASVLEPNLPNLTGLNLVTSIALFLLFLLSVSKHPMYRVNRYLLQIGLFIIVAHAYLASYLSNIHPMFVVILALTTALTPFVLNKIKEVIIFSVFHLICVSSILFLLDYTIYNEILFLIAIMVSVCLSIFTTYIRNESLQKLIFISGIMNKGNMVAIAFDQSNQITYMSENSLPILNINSNSYLGKHISELNLFVNHDLTKTPTDLAIEFQDERRLLIPMKSKSPKEPEIWMEWESKVFSKKIKVVFGMDISDRVNIENNYESLVENAEDLIYFVDVNGNFVYTNNKFQQKLDFEENELINRDSLFLVGEQYTSQVKAFYENQFNNKIQNTYSEFPIRKSDGTEIWIGQNTSLLFAAGSTKIVKGFLSLARDITEKREQQKLIQEQNESITSSINYAKRIQYNLLPSREKAKNLFSEFEVCYEPKDIVSGDFYWLEKLENKTVFVLSDCTGHGVPGSFMTLLGINLLNQIISEDKLTDPGEILSKMDKKLFQLLPREGSSSMRDGMEMTVLLFDQEDKSLKYGCAGGKFVTIQHGEPVIHRGESKHIGDLLELNFTTYNTYSLDISEVEAFYLFTDGIQNQFSEREDKKFTLKRLLEILKKEHSSSVEENVEKIKSKLKDWKGKKEQTDDITIIGFKL